ncbi:MAG: hypothetical protein NCW75_15080 [Phycisphaera sp.]|nr:MAG: hypothetical protein NCW75_15080 [Phycisphaera sp.]
MTGSRARALGVAALGVVGAVAIGEETGFDGFASGFLGRTFADGGITFSENLWFPGGNQVQFAATNGTGSIGSFPEFSPVNVMTTGSWSSGPVLGFTRTHQWIATTGDTASTARIDLFWLGRSNWEGTEVCLEGLVGDDVVVSDCFIHPGVTPSDIQHTRMEISGVEFERIRFIARGGTMPGELDGILAVFDNVVIEAGVACRADIDGDGELTIFDFLGYQNLFDAGDLRADFDGDGELTIFDFLAFQNEFDAGCG